MEQKTITPKEQRAIDKVKRANAELARIHGFYKPERGKAEVYT